MSDRSRTLSITRRFKANRATIWRCWTQGDLLKQWFCPKPWTVSQADLDVRPGGASMIIMNGPNGEVVPNPGQYLAVTDGESLIFTDAYIGDWLPSEKPPFMTGYVKLSDLDDGGTAMEWGAKHWSEEAAEQHKAMGFEAGWNAAAYQLDALSQTL
jgi:uncharacterized protein YndB with AHSA1/START domain